MDNFDPEDNFDFDFDLGDNDDISFLESKARSGDKFFKHRVRAYTAVKEFIDTENDQAINEVVKYCERRLGWQLEVATDSHLIDDILLRDFGIFDDSAWLRYKNSWWEKRARYDMYHLGLTNSHMFARSLAKKKLSRRNRAIIFVREIIWAILKKVDRKIQKF